MKRWIYLICLLGTVFSISGCCWTDHSKEIKKIAVPMAKELEHFYKKEKRFPTIKERDKMLEKIGCRMDGDLCMYGVEKIDIVKSDEKYNTLDIWMQKENTLCFIVMHKEENQSTLWCRNKPCIKFGQ